MPHLEPGEAQDQIAEEAPETEQVQETLLSEPAPPPETQQALFYRLGQMEARQEALAAALAASLQVTQQQAQELETTEQQLEIQQEVLQDALEEGQEGVEEECQGKDPPLWCRLLGGQRRR